MRHIDHLTVTALSCATALICACTDDGGLLVGDLGLAPTADARVSGQAGKEVMLEFAGEPLDVTLDGSHSRDPDGRIVTYRWLSGMRASSTDDAGEPGPSRVVPEGEEPTWPEDVVRPQVTLDQGDYVFTLWVIDERGNVSTPDSVRVSVSAPLDATTQSCLDGVAQNASRSCAQCVCGVSDMCREAVSASACSDTCWGLLTCIWQNCPDFMPGGDTTCLTSKCTQFLSAGQAARTLTPCITDCSDTCGGTP